MYTTQEYTGYINTRLSQWNIINHLRMKDKADSTTDSPVSPGAPCCPGCPGAPCCPSAPGAPGCPGSPVDGGLAGAAPLSAAAAASLAS